MGLMSSLWNSIAGPSDVEEAIIDAICATVLFDDELSDDEIGYAVAFVGGIMEVTDEEAAKYFDDGLDRVRGQDVNDLISSIRARLTEREQRHVAFLAAVGASRVEGGFFSWGEEDFLHALADGLELSKEEMKSIEKKAEEFIDA